MSKNMPPEPSDEANANSSRFEKLLAVLARDQIDYAVVGGLAVILNGYPRVTVDVDILVDDNPENLRKLLDSLAGWGEGWARELSIDDFAPQEGSIRVMEEFDLDIFTRIQGKSMEDFRPRLRYLAAEGVRIPFLGAEDLISIKQNSWREKDQLDVAALRQLLKDQPG
ncbi:MAG TPA: hypothetical protein PK256_20325 [Verrucomicrobiota bacterium]|nr:hypothetical protein [Verrucomicrobiota bacterium]